MGNYNSIFEKLGLKTPEIRALILGLDAAGKTTILYRMKLGEVVTTIPTIGFNVETINAKKLKITAWDVGGRDKIRPLFRHYYQNTQALIFVLDSNDRDRIKEAAEELLRPLREDELTDVSVLILANKQDLPNAMTLEEIKKEIRFDEIKQKPKEIYATVATTGQGLNEALEWLTECFKNGVKNENLIVSPLKETLKDTQEIIKTSNWSFYFSNLPSKISKMVF